MGMQILHNVLYVDFDTIVRSGGSRKKCPLYLVRRTNKKRQKRPNGGNHCVFARAYVLIIRKTCVITCLFRSAHEALVQNASVLEGPKVGPFLK
jgi:hypothetical protein